MNMSRKIADKKLLRLLNHIIDSTNTQKGIPIGNLTSQLFANIYLDTLDKHAKHQLKARHYIRYMDDFIILHESKNQLQKWKEEIRAFLSTNLKLEYSEKKANIFILHLTCP